MDSDSSKNNFFLNRGKLGKKIDRNSLFSKMVSRTSLMKQSHYFCLD
jgi:hypothetical protein